MLKIIGKEWTENKIFREGAHPYWEIVYIKEGKGFFKVENYKFPIRDGVAVIVKPGIIHQSGTLKGSKYFVYWLLVENEKWKVLSKKEKFKKFNVQERILIEILLDKLYELYTFKYPQRVQDGILTSILTFLEISSKEKFKNKSIRLRSLNVCEKIKKIIEENFDQNITLKDIEKEICLSASRIAHLFKETTGISIKKYLLYHRIEKAKVSLIRDFDIPTKEIARKSGFLNLYYFYYQFKKITGLTPTEYRRKHIYLSR